ncbi:hypothetical protein J2I47_09430 [Fibrella sp. HMF5335]|uniref:Uncharacterized protein n=1 Tax=Fibrella rubiginis TaxID=2817060 RepID=A0A939GCV6_9BACT|nr:hypothetical protein [Fibrella rubiginis]MBO0936762.1 hypothetical protein [Fibrella rubiginis]
MITPWIGSKKILVIPVIVTGSAQYLPPPADWLALIKRRIYYDPHPTSGVDRSLRGYIHAISCGKAQLVADVSEPIRIPVAADGSCRTGAAIQAHPHAHLYEFACVIFTDGPHNCGGMAAWGGLFTFSPPRPGNILHGRTRVKLSEQMGVWAMELLHAVTGFGDLYFTNPHPGRFDEMACACGTHPSAYTKMYMGWINASTIPFVETVLHKEYLLYAVGLLQPPPPQYVSALKIPIGTLGHYYIVECRLRVDQFEKQTEGCSAGIPSEGVIVNEVDPSGPSPLTLKTTVALTTGQNLTLPDIGASIEVKEAVNGGYRIAVQLSATVVCGTLKNQIAVLEAIIVRSQQQLETAAPAQKKAILNRINRDQEKIRMLNIEMTELGCSTD